MRKSKGLGTVIGTVIFLLIALAVIGTLLLISFREQAFSLQLSQAQTLMSEKNAESLSVKVINNPPGQGNNNPPGQGNNNPPGQGNNNQQGQANGQATIQVQICNQGTVSSYVEYVVIVQVINNQIIGPPIQVIGAGANSIIPNPIPPGGTATASVTLNPAINPNNIGVLVVTAYGNVFQGGQLGGG